MKKSESTFFATWTSNGIWSRINNLQYQISSPATHHPNRQKPPTGIRTGKIQAVYINNILKYSA